MGGRLERVADADRRLLDVRATLGIVRLPVVVASRRSVVQLAGDAVNESIAVEEEAHASGQLRALQPDRVARRAHAGQRARAVSGAHELGCHTPGPEAP